MLMFFFFSFQLLGNLGKRHGMIITKIGTKDTEALILKSTSEYLQNSVKKYFKNPI